MLMAPYSCTSCVCIDQASTEEQPEGFQHSQCLLTTAMQKRHPAVSVKLSDWWVHLPCNPVETSP